MEALNISLKNIIAPAFYTIHRHLKEMKYVHYKIKGGRGSTKSSFISIEVVLGIVKDPRANAVVMRKQAVDLRDSVVTQLQWAIDILGLTDYWEVIKNPYQFTYKPTGQRILLRGADEPSKVKSTKFTKGYCKFVWYEEFDEFSAEDIEIINPSLVRGGDDFAVFYSYNPPMSVQSWVNIDTMQPRNDTLVHHSTYLDVPPEWLGKQFYVEADEVRARSESKYRHRFLGEVTGTGGEIFDNCLLREISDGEIKTYDKLLYGCDFGFAIDPLHLAGMHFDSTRRKLYIFKELHSFRMDNRAAVEGILQLCDRTDIITADSAEQRTINEFYNLGLYGIQAAIKGPDSVRQGVKFLQDLVQIVIDPIRCPHTAREFTTYEHERDKAGNFRSEYPDKNNHSIDAVRYALERYALNRSIRFA